MILLKVTDRGAFLFMIVPARDRKNIGTKIRELQQMNIRFLIVCGEKVNHPNVIFRANRGKWDAINFGASFIPKDANVIVLNDVDTEICNFEHALKHLNPKIDLVYCDVKVSGGPQVRFYRLLNPLRRKFHIAASGELMLIKKEVFEHALPLPPCIAEDSYILFKTLESGYRARFCTEAFVITKRTVNVRQEEAYKNRTTLGIYQALDYSKPPFWIRLFYLLLPLFAPFLSVLGEDGKAWAKGINRAFIDHLTKRNPTKF